MAVMFVDPALRLIRFKCLTIRNRWYYKLATMYPVLVFYTGRHQPLR